MEIKKLIQYRKVKKKHKLTKIEVVIELVVVFAVENHIHKSRAEMFSTNQNVLVNPETINNL